MTEESRCGKGRPPANFDFNNQYANGNLIINPGLPGLDCGLTERCDEGSLGTLDFSHDDGTFHLDTADPFNFPGGTFQHVLVDVFLGNFFYLVIPR